MDTFDYVIDDDAPFDTLVLGIGNLLWADEGWGVRCVEEFYRSWQVPPNVRLMDGGTQGLYLVQYVSRAKNLLVFDAIDWGDEPGALRVVRNDEVPAFMGCKKMSLHQTGFQEVISAADLLGGRPATMTLIGVQAEELDDWGGSLRDKTRLQIPAALEIGMAELAAWGIPVERRLQAIPSSDGLLANDLDMASYERRAAVNARL